MSSTSSQAPETDVMMTESVSDPSNEYADPEIPFSAEEMVEEARRLRRHRNEQQIAATLADLRSKRSRNCPVNTAKGYKKGKQEWAVSFSRNGFQKIR